MTDEEFNEFMESALAELSDKQDALDLEYGIGSAARFVLDQSTERLDFFDADDRKVLEAQFIDIGSYAPGPGTWQWGWSNSFVLEPLRAKAEILQELAAESGFDAFGWEAHFRIDDEDMAWAFTAASDSFASPNSMLVLGSVKSGLSTPA